MVGDFLFENTLKFEKNFANFSLIRPNENFCCVPALKDNVSLDKMGSELTTCERICSVKDRICRVSLHSVSKQLLLPPL